MKTTTKENQIPDGIYDVTEGELYCRKVYSEGNCVKMCYYYVTAGKGPDIHFFAKGPDEIVLELPFGTFPDLSHVSVTEVSCHLETSKALEISFSEQRLLSLAWNFIFGGKKPSILSSEEREQCYRDYGMISTFIGSLFHGQ